MESALAPWILSRVDQRDDVGRDGFVQILDTDAAGLQVASPLTFPVQVKATGSSFRETEVVSVKTGHLRLWAQSVPPAWVFFYSDADDRFRARSASDLVREIETSRPHWADQQTVTLRFPASTQLGTALSLDDIRRQIADAVNVLGRTTIFDANRRRVILTDLFTHERSYATEQTAPAVSEAGASIVLVLGPGWRQGDLLAEDVDAARLISTALLLYEEVWVFQGYLPSVLAVTGSRLLCRLLETGRIIPFVSEGNIVYYHPKGEFRGRYDLMTVLSSPTSARDDLVAEYLPLGGGQTLADLVLEKRRLFPRGATEVVVRQTRTDLQNDRLRQLLGLSAIKQPDSTEPIWDARIVNRAVHLNLALAAGEQAKADVIEFESGLSRLASEKWFDEFRFHRLYGTSEAFDAALRASGVPDLGVVVRTLGIQQLADISDTAGAQDFRDWFWSQIAPAALSGGRADTAIVTQAEKLVGIDATSVRVATELKMRIIQASGGDYVLGAYGLPSRLGFASRASRGTAVLQKQASIHQDYKRQAIAERVGRMPEPYDPCPCRSGEKFKFCCGSSTVPA